MLKLFRLYSSGKSVVDISKSVHFAMVALNMKVKNHRRYNSPLTRSVPVSSKRRKLIACYITCHSVAYFEGFITTAAGQVLRI